MSFDKLTLRRRFARWYIFKPKNPNLGKFRTVLELKILEDFIANCNISQPLGIFCGHLIHFMVVRFFPRFGMLHQQKSGNPAAPDSAINRF
jgi:hypothetical protein